MVDWPSLGSFGLGLISITFSFSITGLGFLVYLLLGFGGSFLPNPTLSTSDNNLCHFLTALLSDFSLNASSRNYSILSILFFSESINPSNFAVPLPFYVFCLLAPRSSLGPFCEDFSSLKDGSPWALAS